MRIYNAAGQPFGEALVKSVNHRGYGDAPENTLPAYKLSWEKGFQYVECDVALTSDGIPVLLHDDTINRTARNIDGSELAETINIADITYEQASMYDYGSWKSDKYTGTQIPNFEEFIKLCRGLGLHPYIEIKSTATYTTEQLQNLVDIVAANGMSGNVTWISFSSSYLTKIKEYDPAARLGCVIWTPTNNHIDMIAGWKTAENEVFLDAHYSYIDDSIVEYARSKNVPIECWAITTGDQVKTANPYISGFTMDTIHAGKVLFDNAIAGK